MGVGLSRLVGMEWEGCRGSGGIGVVVGREERSNWLSTRIIITIIINNNIIIINMIAAGLRINYNVALNQQAFQHSTNRSLMASIAVDGDRVTSSSTNCDSEQNEWWTVDLSQLTLRFKIPDLENVGQGRDV